MDKYVMVEYMSSLKTLIPQTFKSMKRVKLTSFEVCKNYLIFGASSGGIYIFKQKPYEFIKLIPSKEGPATEISVSPDEKNLAVASLNGSITILENFMLDFTPLVYWEHEGNIVTVMKWHGDNLYSGDSTGKISVFTITKLLAKTIFQVPSAVLMTLDSSIVQIDTYLNYLLISTKTRTYLCDTEKEQYKQIGKKLRDGNFGSCFLYKSNTEFIEPQQKSVGIYRTIEENETFSSNVKINDTKIYCARPGVRLWEANFEASVLVTYQFKDSLNQISSEILVVDSKKDSKLYIETCSDIQLSNNFNFGKIFPFYHRFIFTYNNEGIYFFEPINSKLNFFKNNLSAIKDVKVINNYIYIWGQDMQISVIKLQPLEEMILNTLLEKQYYLCAEICVHYINDVISLIDQSKKIHLISILQSKLPELEAGDLEDKIKTILSRLNEYKKHAHQVSDKNIAVNNFYLHSNELDQNIHEVDINKLAEMQSLYKQYVLNKSHKKAELTETSKQLGNLNLDEALLLFENFVKYVQEKDNENALKWCQEQLLKLASKEGCEIGKTEEKTLSYLSNSFLELNQFRNFNCKCNFPLPKAHTIKPEYYMFGCKLLDIFSNHKAYLCNIPYMHKYILKKINNLGEITLNLPLITQFNDKHLFKMLAHSFTYDTWDEVVKLFIKIKQEYCLNCGEIICIEGLMSWTDLGLLVVESIGPRNTCKLLKRWIDHIPKGELDVKFFQRCIFEAVYNQPKIVSNFMETVVSDQNPMFEESIEKFLQVKFLEKQHISLKANLNKESEKCVFCELPIDGPILVETKKTACGHIFHSLCYIYSNGICNICLSISS